MNKAKLVKIILGGLFVTCTSLFVMAHEDKEEKPSSEAVMQTSPTTLYEEINREYAAEIKPIFESKCYDCHSDKTKYPWYYNIPGVKQIMDHHIEEGREHLDMSSGYPFSGHDDAVKQLKHIRKAITKEKMPPLYYRIAHSGTGFTDAEKEKVFKWIDQSLEKLKSDTQK